MLMTWCTSQTPKGSVSPSSRRGRLSMESKGFCVNMKKSKFLVSGVGDDVFKKSAKYSSADCCSGISNKSIQCSQCNLWAHKKCIVITESLVADPNDVCRRCNCNDHQWLNCD